MKVVAAAVDCCDDDNGTKGKVHFRVEGEGEQLH